MATEDIIPRNKVIAYAVAFNLSDKLAEEVKESGIGELSRILCNALLKELLKNLLNT